MDAGTGGASEVARRLGASRRDVPIGSTEVRAMPITWQLVAKEGAPWAGVGCARATAGESNVGS